jgi:hypothetical protein
MKITYGMDCVSNFRLGAFATGSYDCICGKCGQRFFGDKRALRCLQCEIERIEDAFKKPERLCPACQGKGKHVYVQEGESGEYVCGLCSGRGYIKSLEIK